MTVPLPWAGAIALTLFCAGLATAATDLAPLNITSTRLEPAALLPAGTVIIDRDTLEDMPVNNLSDALDSIAGVNGRRLYGLSNSRTSIDMLGFGVTGTQNTLVLVNGRRLNQVDLSVVDFSSIPLQAIERIEVLPASGAVLYGNGAVGGAINIVTRERYDSSFGARATAGEFSSSGGNLYASGGSGQLSAMVAGQTFESDGYRDNSAVQQHNAFADLRHQGKRLSAGITVLADDQSLGLPGARTVNPGASVNEIDNDPTGTGTPGDWADQQGVQLLPGVRMALSDSTSAQVDATLGYKAQQYFFDQGFGFTSYTEASTRTAMLNPRLSGTARVLGREHQWRVGLDLGESRFQRHTALNEDTFSRPIHQVEIDQSSQSLYLLDTVFVSEDTQITAGARHEWVSTEARDEYDASAPACCGDARAAPFDLDQDVGIYSLGLRHWLADSLSGFVNVERNARYASVDEFFELDPNNGFVTSLDPLKIQTGKLASAGLDWMSQGQRSTLTAWRGDFSNEIHYSPAAGENVNLDDTRRYGVTLNSRWQLDTDLWLTVNASYQRARFREGPYEGNEVPVVPRQTGYARLDWQAADALAISLAQRYVGRKYFDNDQSNDFGRRIPSYRWTDLELRLDPPAQGAWAKLGVYNVEDKRDVFDYGARSLFTPGVYNGYPLPERHLMVTLGVDL